jgi:hypothetical protein
VKISTLNQQPKGGGVDLKTHPAARQISLFQPRTKTLAISFPNENYRFPKANVLRLPMFFLVSGRSMRNVSDCPFLMSLDLANNVCVVIKGAFSMLLYDYN